MPFIDGEVEGLSVDFAAGRFEEDGFRFSILASLQYVHGPNLVCQPAVERVLLAPGDA
jgi:hypothetical protein